MSQACKDSHQQVVGRVNGFFIEISEQEQTQHSPSDVHLVNDLIVQPDLFWIAAHREQCNRIGDYWCGAPDLIVELLPPSTACYNKITKFDLYETHDVREYLLIDPLAHYLDVWERQAEKFQQLGVFGPHNTIVSSTLYHNIDLKS